MDRYGERGTEREEKEGLPTINNNKRRHTQTRRQSRSGEKNKEWVVGNWRTNKAGKEQMGDGILGQT